MIEKGDQPGVEMGQDSNNLATVEARGGDAKVHQTMPPAFV